MTDKRAAGACESVAMVLAITVLDHLPVVNPLLWFLARAVFDKCTQNTNYMVRREFIGKRESRTRLVSFCCPSCVKAKLVRGHSQMTSEERGREGVAQILTQ